MKTINYENKTINIISTAHVSAESVLEVKNAIDFIMPDVVCVELDNTRAENIMKPASNPDIIAIIKSGKVISFTANLILSSYQKRIANELDTQVGGEMIQAINSAKEHNIPVRNIDRDVQVTFARIFANIKLREKLSLVSTLIASIFTKETIDEESIENLKQSDLLFESVKELDDTLPNLSNVLLHERNQYMAEKVKALPYDNILVVLGAAHTEGFIESFDSTYSIRDLSYVPPKKDHKIVKWVIPSLLVSLLLLLTLKNPQIGMKQLGLWLTLSAGGAFVSTLILRTHIYTSLVTLVTAPIGTLSPFLAVGIFAAGTEAVKRPPHESDFQDLAEDVSSIKMWTKNKVLRLLLIFIVTNLVSSIGTFIALGGIISKLFN